MIIAAAVVAMVALTVLLLAVTGGPVLIHTDHDLPEPARRARTKCSPRPTSESGR